MGLVDPRRSMRFGLAGAAPDAGAVVKGVLVMEAAAGGEDGAA